jgi:hypothetical protein
MINTSEEFEITADRLCRYFPLESKITSKEVSSILNKTFFQINADKDRLASDFETNKYVLFRKFIPIKLARAIEFSLPYITSRYQHINAKAGGDWSVYMLDESLRAFSNTQKSDAFSTLILSEPLVRLLCYIAGSKIENLLTTKRWINYYKLGEYITAHKDTTGDFQAVLCLTAPPKINGGQLIIENIAELTLNTGDLLFFRASSVRHWMLPLKRTKKLSDPIRVTTICRFYEIGGKDPYSAVAVYDD